MMQSAWTIYATLLLAGLTGSLAHCSGMCGPLVLMVGSQLSKASIPRAGAFALYHGARIAVYALLGALVGLVGDAVGFRGSLGSVAAVMSVLLGALVAFWGLSYLGVPVPRVEAAGRWVSTAMARVLQRGGARAIPLLGALNGLLPCGLVYGTLLVTASLGSPGAGALGMTLFGLGTAPALFLIGAGAGAIRGRVRQLMSRGTGALLMLVGAQLALRGLAAAGVVAHLHLGRVMLW